MKLVAVLVTLTVFSAAVNGQRKKNRKNNKINWNKRIKDIKEISAQNAKNAEKQDASKNSLNNIADKIQDQIEKIRNRQEQKEATKHQTNLDRLADQFSSVKELTSQYTPLDLQRKAVQETIQGNITMNVLRESISSARKHAKNYENIFSEKFLDIFEQMAEDQIFNQKRRVQLQDAERMLMARSSGQCRNGGPVCTSYKAW